MIPDISIGEIALRLVVAAALSGLVGLEREWRERAAGLRTHMLVGVGSALFTLISAYGFNDFLFGGSNVVRADPSRIAAQIVTGIGFLGAGAIMRQGLNIRGLTTAAGLWVVAAIGMAVGAGYYAGALIGTGVVLFGLGPLRWAEGYIVARRRAAGRLEVDLRPDQPLAPVLAILETRRAKVERIQLEEAGDEGRELRLEVVLPASVSGPRGGRATCPQLRRSLWPSVGTNNRGLRVAERGQAPRAPRAPARLGDRAARRRRDARGDRRDLLRERSGEGPLRPERRARPLDDRRGLGPRGRLARRGARDPLGPLRGRGANDEQNVAKLLEALAGAEARRPRRPLRVRARRPHPGRPGAPRHGHPRRRDRDRAAGLRRLRLRPGVRPDGREPHGRGAGRTSGSARTAIAPPRRALWPQG